MTQVLVDLKGKQYTVTFEGDKAVRVSAKRLNSMFVSSQYIWSEGRDVTPVALDVITAAKAQLITKETQMTKPTIGNLIREALAAGKDTATILKEVREAFPSAQTTSASVAWYRSQMKKTEGKAPKAPKAPSAKAAAKAMIEKVMSAPDQLYRVGKLKSTMGMEGPGFIVTLYKGPKAVAEAADYGTGGPIMWTWFDTDTDAIVKTVDYQDQPHSYKGTVEQALFSAYCLALPKRINPYDETRTPRHVGEDEFVEDLVNDLQLAKQLTTVTKKGARIAYALPDGRIYSVNAAPTPENVARYVKADLNATVLNGMTVEEGVAFLKKLQH